MPVATSFLNGSLLDCFYLRSDHSACSAAYKGALETLARSTFPFEKQAGFLATVLCTMTPQSSLIPTEKIDLNVMDGSTTSFPFPSLCDQVAEPEAHPDYEAAMATFGQQQRKFKSLVPHRPQLPRLVGPLTTGTFAPRETLLPPLLEDSLHHSSISAALSPRTVVANDRPRESTTTETSAVRKRAGSALSSLVDISPPRPAKMFATTDYKIKVVSFYTTAHPRGYLPVYEYQIGEHSIRIDIETSYILLDTIFAALGPMRDDILRRLENCRELDPVLCKIQGGNPPTKSTWAPFSIAKEIFRRTAWTIRFDLVPLFGFYFPTQCLSPNDPNFADLQLLASTRKTRRRSSEASATKKFGTTTSSAAPSPRRESNSSVSQNDASLPETAAGADNFRRHSESATTFASFSPRFNSRQSVPPARGLSHRSWSSSKPTPHSKAAARKETRKQEDFDLRTVELYKATSSSILSVKTYPK